MLFTYDAENTFSLREKCSPLRTGAPRDQKLVGRISASAAQHDTRAQHPQHLEQSKDTGCSVMSVYADLP